MRHRLLGSTGLVVSELCLGAMTFGRETAEPDAHAILDRFVEAGGNFVDTADIYSAGASEEIVGRWLKRQRREDIVVATKVRYGTGESPNDRVWAGTTCLPGSRRACAGWAPTTSTSTRCMPGTRRLRLRRRWPPGHAGEVREGPLHRGQQLHRLAAPEGPRPEPAARLGAVRHP